MWLTNSQSSNSCFFSLDGIWMFIGFSIGIKSFSSHKQNYIWVQNFRNKSQIIRCHGYTIQTLMAESIFRFLPLATAKLHRIAWRGVNQKGSHKLYVQIRVIIKIFQYGPTPLQRGITKPQKSSCVLKYSIIQEMWGWGQRIFDAR